MTLLENVQRIAGAIEDIKNSIIAKGVTPTGNVNTFADAIRSIPQEGGGTDVSDTTAEPDDVVVGKVFHQANGSLVEGTITDKRNHVIGALAYSDASADYFYFNAPNTTECVVDRTTRGGIAKTSLGSAHVEDVAEGVTFTSADGIQLVGTAQSGGGGIPRPGLVNPIHTQYIANLGANALSPIITWTGKATTIIMRRTRRSNAAPSDNVLYAIDIDENGVAVGCYLAGTSATISRYDALPNTEIQTITQNSLRIKNPSGNYSMDYSIMVFGEV